jgi:hypothetical protein
MNDRNEERFSYVRIAMVMVLFLFVLSAFSAKSNHPCPDPCQSGLVSVVHSVNLNAIPSDPLQLPAFQNSWVTSDDRRNGSLCNECLKRIVTENLINQRFIIFRRVELSIRPVIRIWYDNLCRSGKSRDLPPSS